MSSSLGKRIIVIGPPGAGKSTLSRSLSKATGTEVYHLDRMFWLPNWTESDKSSFDERLAEVLPKSSWIIDGNYQQTIGARLKFADTVIFLDFNRFTCLYRVMKRILKWKGKSRPDMGEGCEEKFDFEFMQWIWNYRRRERTGTLRLLSSLGSEKNVLVFKNGRSVKKFLESL